MGDILTHIDGKALHSAKPQTLSSLLRAPHLQMIRIRLIRPSKDPEKSRTVKLYMCEETDWALRFVMGSDEASWLQSTIEQERFRAIVSSFAWRRGEEHYSRLGEWLSHRASEDFPDAQVLAVRMATLEIPSPAELRELDLHSF